MKRLHDKVSLVTGAAAGLGEAIASEFVAQGATVIVADVMSELFFRTGELRRSRPLCVRRGHAECQGEGNDSGGAGSEPCRARRDVEHERPHELKDRSANRNRNLRFEM